MRVHDDEHMFYSVEMESSRRCSECGRTFQPSSRHKRCPACRSRSQCACGRPKQTKSVVCGACRLDARESNGNWKGGRIYHKAGYVMLRIPGHPRSSGGGYVFEHIVVMEEMLGRFLSRDESVHHRNGLKDDNRRENLELWIRPQPSGIRVEDALAWAWAILLRYQGWDASNNVRSEDPNALGGAGS